MKEPNGGENITSGNKGLEDCDADSFIPPSRPLLDKVTHLQPTVSLMIHLTGVFTFCHQAQ